MTALDKAIERLGVAYSWHKARREQLEADRLCTASRGSGHGCAFYDGHDRWVLRKGLGIRRTPKPWCEHCETIWPIVQECERWREEADAAQRKVRTLLLAKYGRKCAKLARLPVEVKP